MAEKKLKKIGQGSDWVSVNTAQEMIIMKVSDIIRLEAERNYTFIFLENDKKVLVSKNLKEFEQLLLPFDFLRIHKSHLVNVKYISHFVKKGTGCICLKNSLKLQVSVAGREKFLHFLKTNTINL